jgi:hemerythrin-like domain-containing protein
MATPRSIAEMDGITLILTDHRIVEQLFATYERAADAEQRLMVAAKILEELSVHADIEERVLYPLVREVLDDGDELAEHSVEEHREAKETLLEIERTPVADAAFDQRMRELIEEVRHHVEEEESDMLSRLAEALDDDRNLQLGEELRAAKERAPVRPVLDGSSSDGGSGSGGEEPTKEELYERAKEIDLTGRSDMTKDELAEALEQHG